MLFSFKANLLDVMIEERLNIIEIEMETKIESLIAELNKISQQFKNECVETKEEIQGLSFNLYFKTLLNVNHIILILIDRLK